MQRVVRLSYYRCCWYTINRQWVVASICFVETATRTTRLARMTKTVAVRCWSGKGRKLLSEKEALRNNKMPPVHKIDAKAQLSNVCEVFLMFSESSFNPNRSLDPEQISLDCWADGWLWVRRRSGLRWERTSNKMPTRKWKMAGSYILYKKLHHNGLMTDLGLSGSVCDIFIQNTHCATAKIERYQNIS